MLLNILLIVVGFGILIFVHELGHFLAAKWAGIRTEAFAIGMGTPVVSWRKGIGFCWGSTRRRVVERTGRAPADLSDAELRSRGIGETEYSLRWLPIGGFVRMLGQDDTDPGAVSADPRSFNVCPVPRRMVVITAGVLANLVFAVALFVIAFMAGVRAEAPVVGYIAPGLPAELTEADNASALRVAGVQETRLRPGDRIVSLDGSEVRTFADLQIGVAMAAPEESVRLEVRREGVDEVMRFTMAPVRDPAGGLLTIGVGPGSSTTLRSDPQERLPALLEELGVHESGLRGGMRLVAAAGRPVRTFEQYELIARGMPGGSLATTWEAPGTDGRPAGQPIEVDIPLRPEYQNLWYPHAPAGAARSFETGLLGLVPLSEIPSVLEGSANEGILLEGDVVLAAGSLVAPRTADLRQEVKRHRNGPIDMIVLRGGVEQALQARVNRKGLLNVALRAATDVPLVARPMEEVGAAGQHAEPRPTPVARLQIPGGSRLESVGGEALTDWQSFRELLRKHTAEALAAGTGAGVPLAIVHPTPGAEREELMLRLEAADVEALHALRWRSVLYGELFEPIYTTLEAGGNPLRAAAMGFVETHKMIVLTYLTLDRLFRGTVGVEQIHGPVGIVHVGTQAASRGLTYLLFFLGIISVNLAVINFLPLPIVDGGLFIFLVYEKLKGRPPSPAFQNASTILGLVLIGAVLLVVTWNDVVRLLS
jgi:regulator of sigma E protease